MFAYGNQIVLDIKLDSLPTIYCIYLLLLKLHLLTEPTSLINNKENNTLNH